jgi:CelD/BcsL family acetyltransferase involved in cellulose biosynthesis
MLKVREITDFSEFESLRDIWNQLLQKSIDNDVFSTWEWIWCWWKHYGKERKLRILIAEENGEISGIAPLMLSKYNFLHLGKIHKIEFIGTPASDYNSFILIKDEKECLNLFLSKLIEFSDWNLLELKDIRENTISANTLQDTGANQFSRLRIKVGTVCPYISLPKSIELFSDSFGRNMRRNLRKRMRKLRKAYKVEVITHRDFNSVEEAMQKFFSLHQKRWRSKGKQGAFASEAFRGFHLELAKTLEQKGWLALYFLTADDKPVATVYSFDYNNKKYGYLTGFDPEFGRYGVGNLLKKYVAEDCIKNGFKEYDLMRDFEPYKADWATDVRANYVARMTSKGLFAKTYNWTMQNSFAQFLINRLGTHLTLEHIR